MNVQVPETKARPETKAKPETKARPDTAPKPRRRPVGRTGCAVEATLSVIGGLWKPVLLFHLLEGKLRFNALCRLVPNATQRMVTLQLRELEADGIVLRTVHPEVPPKVEYELTPLGLSLEPVLLGMRSWGTAFQAGLGVDTKACD